MRVWSVLLLGAALLLPEAVFAADATPAPGTPEKQEQAAKPPVSDPTYEHRVEMAKKMHELHPTRDQVQLAIEQVAQSQPEADREAFKSAMQNVLNYKAIEKISIDAMAETYSEAELQAMVDYYSKPEAKSASEKGEAYAKKVFPEIMRMLDQAMMRIKTGGN